MNCPECDSQKIIKNGSIHNGKQKYKCKNCGRQFIENPTKKVISKQQWELVDKLLLEKISIAGIHRVTGISKTYLQQYINDKYGHTKQQIESVKKKGKLTIQCDEMWSFVENKKNKQWIWLAIDADSRRIVGVHIGHRDHEGAKCLWKSLPAVYRQCAVCYTDFWSAYENIFPFKRHKPVGKASGKTSYIERLNCTMRQRIFRLVRKTLSFSKKLENHIGAIWNFVHHYNSQLEDG